MFEIRRDEDTLILVPLVNLSDFLFESLAAESKEIFDALDDGRTVNMVVDLRKTSYFGTDFLSILLKSWRKLRPRNGRLALCSLSENEREVLQICQLDSLWPVCDNLDKALQAVRD